MCEWRRKRAISPPPGVRLCGIKLGAMAMARPLPCPSSPFWAFQCWGCFRVCNNQQMFKQLESFSSKFNINNWRGLRGANEQFCRSLFLAPLSWEAP